MRQNNAMQNKDGDNDETYLGFSILFISAARNNGGIRVLGREIIESCGIRLRYIRFAWKH